jgi:hypothetical protein
VRKERAKVKAPWTRLILWGLAVAFCWAAKEFDWFHDTRAWLEQPVSNWIVIVAMAGLFFGLHHIELKVRALDDQIWEVKHALKELGERIYR